MQRYANICLHALSWLNRLVHYCSLSFGPFFFFLFYKGSLVVPPSIEWTLECQWQRQQQQQHSELSWFRPEITACCIFSTLSSDHKSPFVSCFQTNVWASGYRLIRAVLVKNVFWHTESFVFFTPLSHITHPSSTQSGRWTESGGEREGGRSAVILRKLRFGNVLHQTVDASRRSRNLGKRRFDSPKPSPPQRAPLSNGEMFHDRHRFRGGGGDILRRFSVRFLHRTSCVALIFHSEAFHS